VWAIARALISLWPGEIEHRKTLPVEPPQPLWRRKTPARVVLIAEFRGLSADAKPVLSR
jgi:hypothetical protein